MQVAPDTERFFAIRRIRSEYLLDIPEQEGTGSSLTYQPPSDAVAEFHSHGRSCAFFSMTDDCDEQGFRIYGVVGRTASRLPELSLRLGIYGYFSQLEWAQVFSGPAPGIRMVREEEEQPQVATCKEETF